MLRLQDFGFVAWAEHFGWPASCSMCEPREVSMTSRGKRIAWVTGGGSGIGFAGAEALAADSWTVVISGRRLDALADAAKRIGERNSGQVDIFPVDVARADDVHARSAIYSEKARADRSVRKQCRSQRAQAELERARDLRLGPDRRGQSEWRFVRDPRRVTCDARPQVWQHH
jgi:hypothetical protein